ncbi:MAG TPA: nuclear transport factor 2 family protein [Thermoleophilaceae bacterium]
MAETTQVATELDPAWVEDFVQQWAAAWNSHRPDRLLALMTEDIVYDDSAWPHTMRGHADVRGFLESAWTAFPDLRFEESEGPYIAPGQPKAAFQWIGKATHTGPLNPPGLAPTGRSIEFPGADFHEYRDGRVCRLTIVFDMTDVSRQLGLMPKPGSRMEKMGAAAQRLGMKVRRR